MQAGGHEFESRILHADNEQYEARKRRSPSLLGRGGVERFTGRKPVTDMKRSGMEVPVLREKNLFIVYNVP